MEDTNDKQSTIGQLSAQDLSALSPDERMIQEGFNDLLQDYLKSNHRRKVERITKAFNFAKQAHDGVKRRSGEPYIMHPIAVAKIVCSEMGLGSTSICSALLHDVVEDTEYTVEDIRNMFGDKIAQIVDGLTKISGGIFGKMASVLRRHLNKPTGRILLIRDSFVHQISFLVVCALCYLLCPRTPHVFLHLSSICLCGLLQMSPQTIPKATATATILSERRCQAWQKRSNLRALSQGNAGPP